LARSMLGGAASAALRACTPRLALVGTPPHLQKRGKLANSFFFDATTIVVCAYGDK